MTHMERGDLVRSTQGGDAGRLYAVLEAAAGRALVADGSRHRLDSPKRKNAKHIALITGHRQEITALLDRAEDAALRKRLKALQRELAPEGQGSL